MGDIASLQPIIQFCLIMLAGCFLRVILIVVTRGYRAMMIISRGWPPPHLDADGDWAPKDEKDV